jgi:DNA-binding SARP family transcriptional activator
MRTQHGLAVVVANATGLTGAAPIVSAEATRAHVIPLKAVTANARPHDLAVTATVLEPAPKAKLPPALFPERQGTALSSDTHRMTAFMLRSFHVQVDDVPIDGWVSHKAKAVLKLLLLDRTRPVLKDELIERLWPETEPEAGKNNLNVAVHHLRRTLARGHPDFPFVVVRSGSYRLDDRLMVWTDIEAFEQHMRRAGELERMQRPLEAMGEYASCVALHQNELLAEDRYDRSLAPLRQRFRDHFLDALDRLARHHLEGRDQVACTSACAKILALDPCNEAAHRTLMKCYAMLGQPNLVQLQYRSCVSVLSRELGVAPSTDTTALYRALARGEASAPH